MQQVNFRGGAAENAAELIAREYQDFVYIVSHDLNAPLRHVKEFTRLLIGGRKDNLSDEEQEYIRFLELSLDKLEDMQKALLTFSRLYTRAGPLRPVNVNHVITEALREIDGIVAKYHTKINCDDLPTVVAEPKQLHMLFLHLIENALKFHESDISDRELSIRAVDQKEAWLFEVKDNGIGIKEDHIEEVFRPFRRLHPEKYPGIGEGLTIAHKIVQLHGGEMLIESEPGEGTSVFFTIPK